MTERLSNKNPCNACKVDRQIGNPNRWECGCDGCNKPYDWKSECVKKLAEYETAEDEGRLLILPCKAGDTVYHVGSYSGITKHTIRELIVDTEGAYACSLCKFPISQFGVSVFLTYEEAEKALGELREK